MKLLASVALAALATGCTAQRAAPATGAEAFPLAVAPARCAATTAAMLGGASAGGTWVPAAGGNPSYCEVKGTLSPASGSTIGVVYRLPEAWNGKVLGIGGGGWQGNVTLQAATEGLKKGYATLQTDAGHVAGPSVWDTTWAGNVESQKDFSYRAVHEMTVAGKKLVRAYYARMPEKSYFQGCSTGGRMALMEAQRYPADYDAISAGAPVYTLQVQTSSVLRNLAFAGAGFSPADLKLAQGAALAACDVQDGLKDGLINDPRQCRFDPAPLQCTGGKSDSCLSAGQVTALRVAYDGIRGPDGQWAMLPMSRGGEPGWRAFVGTDGSGSDASSIAVQSLFTTALGRPMSLATYRPLDVPAIRNSAFGKWYEAGDTNLAPFFARGGKLLLWHGENDPGPSPVGTADYARAVLAKGGKASQNMRLFLLPGVEHCGGGPGASPIPLLDTIDGWVATGAAPMSLVGAKPDNSVVRPQCAWPKVARYNGAGSANDPASWQCVARPNS
ncbi:MAG: tannase/feruloyl esterase family alpha/beta hydrolase [Croceibacterium sp.]